APLAGEVARAEEAFLVGTGGLLDLRTVEWYRAAGLLHLSARGLKTGRNLQPPREAQALVAAAGELAEGAGRSEPRRAARPAGLAPRRSALELVLQALATRPATPEELDQIRRLLDESAAPR